MNEADQQAEQRRKQAEAVRKWRHNNSAKAREYSRTYSAQYREKHPEQVKKILKKYQSKPAVKQEMLTRALQWQKDNPEAHLMANRKSTARKFLDPKPAVLERLLAYSPAAYAAELQFWIDTASTLVNSIEHHNQFDKVTVPHPEVPALDPGNEQVNFFRQTSAGAYRFIGFTRRGGLSNTPARYFAFDRKLYATTLHQLIALAEATMKRVKELEK